jgi:hypothetical protein
MLQIHHRFASTEDTIYILLRMCRTHAEPYTAHQWRRRIRDDHNNGRRLPILHHPVEHVHLSCEVLGIER